MGTAQEAAVRIEQQAAEALTALQALLERCRDSHERLQRATAATAWVSGEAFCRIAGVLSQANNQRYGNRGTVQFDGFTHQFTGYDSTGRPLIERRKDPGPGFNRRRRQVVRFREPDNDIEVLGLAASICGAGDSLKRRGRRP